MFLIAGLALSPLAVVGGCFLTSVFQIEGAPVLTPRLKALTPFVVVRGALLISVYRRISRPLLSSAGS